MAAPSFRKIEFVWRRSLVGGVAASLLAAFSLGCATTQPSRPDRYSPAEMQHGPSLYETGRFGTVPLSNGNLKVDEGAIDRAPAARQAPTRAAEQRRGKRKPRARAERTP